MINRSSVIVQPKQPYIDWAMQLEDTDDEPNADKTVYLIPAYNDDVEALEILSQCFDIIFDVELESWHKDKDCWPKNRTFSLFRDWFDYEFHAIVEDLCNFEISYDEFA